MIQFELQDTDLLQLSESWNERLHEARRCSLTRAYIHVLDIACEWAIAHLSMWEAQSHDTSLLFGKGMQREFQELVRTLRVRDVNLVSHVAGYVSPFLM